jgi:hypothetical protein
MTDKIEAAELRAVIEGLEKLSKRWPEQVLPRAIALLRQSASGEPSEDPRTPEEKARDLLSGYGDDLLTVDVRSALKADIAQAIRAALQAAGIQSGQAERKPFRMLVDKDWLRNKILNEPDEGEVSAGVLHPEAPRAAQAPTDDAIRSTVKLNSTPDRLCTVFKGTEITGYTLTDEGIAELRKLFGASELKPC